MTTPLPEAVTVGSPNHAELHNETSIKVNDLVDASSITMRVVAYGAVDTTARPVGVVDGGVYWIGTSATLPINALPNDLISIP